jgi:exosortase
MTSTKGTSTTGTPTTGTSTNLTLPLRIVAFAAVVAAACAANWTTVGVLWARSEIDNTASHIVIMPLLSAGLIALNWRQILAAPRTWWQGGVPVLVLGAALAALLAAVRPEPLQPDQSVALTLAAVPLVVLWTGAFLLLFGSQAARAAAFPLAMLWFTAPFPAILLQPVNDMLKAGSASVVAALFEVTGTPFVRDDYFSFRLPFVSIEIADECSGIRSSIGLLLTTLLAAHQWLTTSWRRAVLVLAIVPVTIFKNGVRIATLSLLSIHVDPSYLTGQLHHEGGILFFTISLMLMSPVLFALVRSERRRATSRMSGVRAATA